jgi:acetyl-CoA carboxylase carboxyl transferase subunit beta
VRRIFHRDRHGEPVDSVPADLWERCPQCRQLNYVKEFARNLKVCQKCRHHFRLGAQERLTMLLDEDSFVEEDAALEPRDPLGFVSAGQSYRDKLAETQARSHLAEAIVCGRGLVDELPLRVAVCDFDFLGASMGSVVGEKVTRAAERSAADGAPLLLVSASGGARMHEGIFSLMQMAKTVAALEQLARARVPYVSLLTDPTTGGVTASFAALGDVILAEPGALIGFAGPRVIEQTIRETLPPGFQRSEYLVEKGMVDRVTHRKDLPTVLGSILGTLMMGRALKAA